MNYPTGMGMYTGNHYNNVAVKMQAYLNNPSQQSFYQFHNQSPVYNIGANLLQYGAQRIGIHPMAVNQVGGFARQFMRNVLS